MKKIFYLFLFFAFLFPVTNSYGQACQQQTFIDTAIPCSQNCVSLSLTIPNVRQSTDYQIVSGAYLPYPYQCPSDVELTTLNIDDQFSPVINMPFSFCFYGASYNKCVVGSNGVISFDISNADCENNYFIPNGTTIPYAGGTQCTLSGTGGYYPRASIMGAYYDIDPNAGNASFIGRRISYYFTGTAPNRKMVVVYYRVPVYGSTCNNLIANQQIVLHESTGIIDVHLGNKPLCTASTSNGRAILGIQNWDRTQAVAAPGKNATQWSATNETYRFIPSGGTGSLFKKVELFNGTTLVATGDTTSISYTELKATFPSACFNTDTAAFRVVTTYASCADGITLVTAETKIVVRHNGNLPVTAAAAPGTCGSGGNGTITVSSPVGPGYQYSIDNGVTYQLSPSFTAPAGNYTVLARDIQSSCAGSASVSVPLVETIRFSTNITDATCYGTATGKVLVITQSGAAPFQFSADSGLTYQGSNLLFVGAGTHTIRVMDQNGCIKDTLVTIGQPDSIRISTQVNAAYCSGNPDGQIIVAATGGTPAYRYALTNTTAAYQSSTTLFANVGSFTVYVKDNNNCVDSLTGIAVPLNDTLRLVPLPDTTLCVGSPLTIVPNTNATQFSWSPATAFSDSTAPRPVVAPQDTTVFYLQARLGTLCSRTDTFTVNVLKRPVVDAGNDTTICFGTQAYFQATAIRTGRFRWSPAANLSSSVIPNPVATGYIPITYVVEATDPYGCGFREYDFVRLTVRPRVRAFAGQDTTATIGQPVQLSGCCMDIYQWQPASVFLNDTARNPIGLFPAGITRVIMTTTTPEGCEGRDTVLVTGYNGPTYYVPSAFTPNGDGRNDVFRPVPVGITETYYFHVYNRYGQLVYSTRTFMEGWDGRFKGQLQPQAAYIWMVKGLGANGKLVEQKGTVVLMQ